MCKVIEFPVQRAQTWAVVERGMREVLAAAGSPQDMIDTVCARMRPVFDQLQFSYEAKLKLPIPALATETEIRAAQDAVAAAFRDLERQIHEFSYRTILERLKTEAELYVARRQADSRAR
jgi:hypothetical protein